MAELREGAPVLFRNKPAVTNCGFKHGEGRGNIAKMDPTSISVYYWTGSWNQPLEMVMTRSIFEVNFMLDPFRMHDLGRVRMNHYTKRFPDDFLKLGYEWSQD
ncbi:hypothetical protein LJ737_03410 [Hymenobacter sp. 15J16-1T3B]|uniref:hypothetical protein n=1 Tax=Hymenobacter sp. 15J16-1T3B TaxID=2886941 RepID=UPI001D0FC24D|nr:hypothetical protein [Hymenobacter sp. 15J16-1T3B]MCC3156267.1 hypothetical protein [Hymenobacter sp. 15J16-1T3B]